MRTIPSSGARTRRLVRGLRGGLGHGLMAAGAALVLLGGAAGAPTLSATRPEPRSAVALLHSTQGHQAQGRVRFERDGDAVVVTSQLSGLRPGAHGYHVHLYGDCSAPDAASAGPHFDFRGPAAPADVITGNLGELVADASGEARAEARVANARIEGPNSILGRAVVVHAQGNDPGQPPNGNAGARVACGVIGIAKP